MLHLVRASNEGDVMTKSQIIELIVTVVKIVILIIELRVLIR